MGQRGNILFLILLAVVLFAFLSYAVTASMRGGGNVADDETLELMASDILNQVTSWRTAYVRLDIAGDIDQIQFTEDAKNYSGTCYEGSTSRTPCTTIGLFNNAITGLPKPVVNLDWFDSTGQSNNYHYFWLNTAVQSNGNDIGTSAADSFIQLQYVTTALCAKINKQLGKEEVVPSCPATTGGSGRTYAPYYSDTQLFGGYSSDSYTYNIPYYDVCCIQDGVTIANFFLDEN